MATRPRAPNTSSDRHAAPPAAIDIPRRPAFQWQEAGADLLQRRAGQLGDPKGDPVVPMMRMSPAITVEMVPHVNQLLADDDLQGAWGQKVDPGSIDQDRVGLRLAQEAVGAAVTGGHPPAQPASEDSKLVGHPEVLRWQCQPGYILVDESGDVGAADLRPSQDSVAKSSGASPA